jgi:hypothetical protein
MIALPILVNTVHALLVILVRNPIFWVTFFVAATTH